MGDIMKQSGIVVNASPEELQRFKAMEFKMPSFEQLAAMTPEEWKKFNTYELVDFGKVLVDAGLPMAGKGAN